MLCGARSGRGGARLVRDSTAPPPNMRSPTPMGCLRPHVSAPAVPTGEPRPCQRRTGGSAPVSAAQRVRRPPVHRNACASRSQRCDSIPPNSAMGYPFRNSEICRRFSFFALRAFFYMRKNSKHLQISEFLNKPEPCRPQDRLCVHPPTRPARTRPAPVYACGRHDPESRSRRRRLARPRGPFTAWAARVRYDPRGAFAT